MVAVAHNSELVERVVNPTLEDIADWMSSNGLQLAPEKSECVVLTNKKACRVLAVCNLTCHSKDVRSL